MKKFIIIALLGISTLANATSSYDPSCTTIVTDSSTSSLLFCNLPNSNPTCTTGSVPTYCDPAYSCFGTYDPYSCFGTYNNGGCNNQPPCNPPPVDCPDTTSTLFALALALMTLEVSRRKLAPAK
ncbi:MAG: hypothetical protein RL616_820 [Verrucomicrobiota bacterium]